MKEVDERSNIQEESIEEIKTGLPKVELPSDDVLKNSVYNPTAYVDVYATSFTDTKQTDEIQESELYKNLVISNTEGDFAHAYGEPDEDYDVSAVGDDVPRFGAIGMKIITVRDKGAHEQFKQDLREMADEIHEQYDKRLSSKDSELQYIDALYSQIEEKRAPLDEAIRDREDFIKEANEAIAQEKVRAKEALEAVQKEDERVKEEIKTLEERLKDLPQAESDSFEYNPFSTSGNRRQTEMGLTLAKENEAKIQKQLADAQAMVERAERRTVENYKSGNITLDTLNEKVAEQEERFAPFQAQFDHDAVHDNFEQYKDKTVAVMDAMQSKRLRRSADGFSEAYLLKICPFDLGINAFGPCMNLSDSPRSMVSKVAEATRLGYPIYDALLQTDAATDTIVDYTKDKEAGKLNPDKEKNYRRKMYDHVSQIERCLDIMYDTSLDPVKNENLRKRGITDPLNEPFHIHKYSPRGSMVLYTAAQAYKTGIENNWDLEDCRALSAFNFAMNVAKRGVEYQSNVSLAGYEKYKEPKYKDDDHKAWMDDMEAIWNKVKKTPLQNAEMRKDILEEMNSCIEKGHSKGYLDNATASAYSMHMQSTGERSILIEEGKEKAVADPISNLSISARGRQMLKQHDEAIKINEQPKKRENTRPEENEEISFEAEKDLNTAFTTEDRNEYLKNVGMSEEDIRNIVTYDYGDTEPESSHDWQYAQAVEKFTAKRSKVFLGRESDEHKNLRVALEEMNELRHKPGGLKKTEDLAEYFERLDEVRYRSAIYIKEKSGANTPAGIERLEGAKEIEQFAKDEMQDALDMLNDRFGEKGRYIYMRERIAKEKSEKAQEQLLKLCDDGMPQTKEAKQKASDLAADIIAGNFAASNVNASKNGFNSMGRLALKNDIMKSKEFKAAMEGYYKKPDMDAATFVNELKNGKAMSRINKIHKKFQEKEKERLRKLNEAATEKKEPSKKK